VNNKQVNINAYDSLDDSYTEKFKKLTPKVIREVLLIASLYDAFLLEEEGRLIDLMIQSYSQKGYGFIPVISRVNSFEEARLKLEEHPFQLVIAVLRKNDQHQKHLLQDIKSNYPDLPLIGLAFHSEDLLPFTGNDKTLMVDQVFLWQGEGKILLGIIQYVEDKINALHDIQLLNVPCLLLVEDSVPFYSSYFHVIDEALWTQMSASFRDDLPYMSRILRLKARPKILLANTYEEGVEYYKQYKHHLIGIITDLCYDRSGKKDPTAGVDFAQMLHLSFPDLPIIIQSSENNVHPLIKNIGAGYLDKNSKTLIRDFKTVLNKYFGFGELVFKNSDGSEIARTSTIEGLLSIVDTLPPDILRKQYDGNYLKRWFWVRAEFELADLLYCDDLLEEKNPIRFRQKTKDLIQLYLRKSKMGSLVPFSRKSSYNYWHISKLGEGSIGGKARGLVFMDKVLQNFRLEEKYPQIHVSIPRSLILGTDIFDEFIQKNNLAPACLKEDSDMRIAHAFLNAELPPTVIGDLRDFIMNTRKPLAVRSSSLLEDALYQPFAGVYATKMVPNNHLEASQRFQNLTDAIKLVYASTFFRQAKNYIESTQHRIEEEKMGIILQEVVGRSWNNHYYPLISGVARSYNFYPTGYGLLYFTDEMLKDKGLSLQGKKIIISGSGNVSIYATEKAQELGGIVITASDSNGYIVDQSGIKLDTVKQIKEVERGRISDYVKHHPTAEYHEGWRGIWGVKADIALPCATENEIDGDWAKKLVENGVFAVAEGANMPSSPEAIKVFQDNKVLFGPAKAANAGGVATSALEMSQNSMRYGWTFEEVDQKLKQIMVNIYHNSSKTAKEYGYTDNLVKGANIAGFLKVANTMLAHGVF